MSDLLWYFQRPSTPPFQELRYSEFFSSYYLETLPSDDPLDRGKIRTDTVNAASGDQQKVVRPRIQGAVVTRLHTVPVRVKELLSLRALLRIRPAYSFQDLRTVQGRCYSTYQEAATALGLFQDVREAVYAMNDSIAAYSRPSQLRFLFAYLLLDLPFPAIELWAQFRQDLCADYQLHHPLAQATNMALEVARYLSTQGASLTQYGLPEPRRLDSEIDLELRFFHPYLHTLRRKSEEAHESMNLDQRAIFDRILCRRYTGGCFFIDGRACRGKTFVMDAICDRFCAEETIICVTGTTALKC